MEIEKYNWPENTRNCDFCLCFQGGCVFADFVINREGLVQLVRISFDGFGCCTTDGKVTNMSACDSAALTGSISCDDLNTDLVRDILYRYFIENRDVIWEDALIEHRLLII